MDALIGGFYAMGKPDIIINIPANSAKTFEFQVSQLITIGRKVTQKEIRNRRNMQLPAKNKFVFERIFNFLSFRRQMVFFQPCRFLSVHIYNDPSFCTTTVS
jgi:hypothetical protein